MKPVFHRWFDLFQVTQGSRWQGQLRVHLSVLSHDGRYQALETGWPAPLLSPSVHKHLSCEEGPWDLLREKNMLPLASCGPEHGDSGPGNQPSICEAQSALPSSWPHCPGLGKASPQPGPLAKEEEKLEWEGGMQPSSVVRGALSSREGAPGAGTWPRLASGSPRAPGHPISTGVASQWGQTGTKLGGP